MPLGRFVNHRFDAADLLSLAQCYDLLCASERLCQPRNLLASINEPQMIAKDDDAQYVECLDCGEILEVGELKDGGRI